MNKILHIVVAVALTLVTLSAAAQVEYPVETVQLDTTNMKLTYDKPNIKVPDLNFKGKTVVKFTLHDLTPDTVKNVSYVVTVSLKRFYSTGTKTKATISYGFVRDSIGERFYKLYDNENNGYAFYYKDEDIVYSDSVNGSLELETTDSKIYLDYFYQRRDCYGYKFYWVTDYTGSHMVKYDGVNFKNYMNGIVGINGHSKTTICNYIFDDKPLWVVDGEDTNDPTNILSNRLNKKYQGSFSIDIFVKRKLYAGTWTTLCLPFNVERSYITQLGSNVKIASFSNVDTTKQQINFRTADLGYNSTFKLKKGQPYLVYYEGEDKDGFWVKSSFNYTTEEYQKELTALKNRKSSASNGYYFVGLLEPTEAGAESEELNGGSMVYITKPIDGKQHIKRLADGGRINGFRAYLYYPPEATDAAAKGSGIISIDEVLDGDATGLVTVAVDGKPISNRIYNLQGQYVGTRASSLQPGIYVRNGKKFVVR